MRVDRAGMRFWRQIKTDSAVMVRDIKIYPVPICAGNRTGRLKMRAIRRKNNPVHAAGMIELG